MKNYILFLSSAILFISCSSTSFNKVMKSNDFDYKLKMADKYYGEKKYNKAQQLYVELFPVFKGTENFEDLYYKYAYCSYYLKDYMNAENLFSGYLGVFPNSNRAEEVAYMQSYCFFKQSPKVELDQTNTLKAIGMMQTFMNNYPNSPRVADAQNIINESRRKLEEKQFKSARLYYDLQQYQAAGIYFQDLANQYPDSEKGDEYMYMVLKSNFEFASKSISDKQEERFEKVITEFYEFADRYPESSYMKDAQNLKLISENNIKQLKNEQTNKTAGS